LTTFELRTFSPDSKFDERFLLSALLLNANWWKNPRSVADFICTDHQRLAESADKPVFSQIQPITQTTRSTNANFDQLRHIPSK